MTWLFALLAIASIGLFLYPYTIYPVLLRFFPARPVRKAPYDAPVSLLFCAYNEAQSLPPKIENLRRLKALHPDLEILVFDDGSSDATADILRDADEIVTLVEGAGRSGKAAGMKQLATMARGQILMFTDANVILADDSIERLLPYYVDPDVGGVCGTLRYETDPNSATASVGSAYWSLDERLRTLESRSGNVMGADGSLFSVRRSLYPDFPDSALDDFVVSLSVIFAGSRLVKAPDVRAFENSVTDRGDEMRRKVRIGARAYHTHSWLRPKLRKMTLADRFKYTSRKVMRWFGGVFLILAAVFALATLATLSLASAAIALLAMLLAAVVMPRLRNGIAAKLSDAVMAIFATLAGIVKGLRGETMATWNPAKTR